MDFGVTYKNYNSDMTRTVFIGTPTKDEIETYDKLKKVQQETIDKSKIGMTYSKLDKISRDVLKDKLMHALGHGLGLEVHEGPSVGPRSKDKIEIGHVFTIEPGEYETDKYGLRIEDDVAMTKHGLKVLTKSSKELIIIN